VQVREKGTHAEIVVSMPLPNTDFSEALRKSLPVGEGEDIGREEGKKEGDSLEGETLFQHAPERGYRGSDKRGEERFISREEREE